ncbi:hypothetical protein GCM10007086_21860 [Photobacterium aphoticum]|nr:hypothetical protein GCM10007086_21860 [Photobacterium aphoticum]
MTGTTITFSDRHNLNQINFNADYWMNRLNHAKNSHNTGAIQPVDGQIYD